MTYRLHDDLEYGGGSGTPTEAESSDGELSGRSRHGAHHLDTETGVHRYVYERPADAPTRSRARHAAPDASTPSEPSQSSHSPRRPETPPRGPRTTAGRNSERASRWDTDTYGAPGGFSASGGYGGSNYGESAYGGSNYDAGNYGGLNYDGPIDHETIPNGELSADRDRSRPHWDDDTGFGGYRTRGGEPSAWNSDALNAAAGVSYRPPLSGRTEPMSAIGALGDRTAPLAPVGSADDRTAQLASVGTLTAPRPEGPPRRPESEAPTALVEAAAPAEAEVPLAPPPTEGGRLRFLGKKHVGLRVAAVSLLVLGSAIGISIGVLRDNGADKVKVSDDVQADVAATAAPTPDAAQSRAAAASSELLIKQRQQEALNAAKKLAASKASAAQTKAAARATEADKARASRSESRGTGTTGTTGDAVPNAPVDCKSYSGNRATGCALLQEYGFDTSQMSCLDNIFTKESQWNPTAENQSSGAYGIPQALPGDKMASVADDWRTNAATQIRWGLGYIKDRYGTPCDAWAHWQANSSY